ncbi:helix-turn-helix domain-containing protein [Mycobacterium sp.]|uniref:helix-turn-helix transcriptional regulator n=1 Tax=Mycobacterium sp. TaxID=1785 RepID=UPI001224941A|nr:helix-turn-helix domain-containing protein [Mycobacterium sp.]TAM62852.1 MAG: DNA-binding protein [Mycobacterium sp.]
MSTKRERLDLKQVADRLHVSVCTARRLVAGGQLPAHRLGPRLIRVWSDDLDKIENPIGSAA